MCIFVIMPKNIIMKQDDRIQQTEKVIEQAFLQLIEEKGFSNVKLVDIAERANVNRNTIYLRYGTKDDLIDSLLKKTYKRAIDLISQSAKTKVRNRKMIENLIRTIFTVIDEDVDLYRIVLTDINLTGYMEKIMSAVRKDVMTYVKDTKENRIALEYIIRGVFGVLRDWIIFDVGTLEENVKLVSNLVMSNSRALSFI